MGNSLNINCCNHKDREEELNFPITPGTPVRTPKTIVSSLKNRSSVNDRESSRKTVNWAPTPKEVVKRRFRDLQSDDTGDSTDRPLDQSVKTGKKSNGSHIPVVRALGLQIERDHDGSIIELEDA